MMPTIEKDRGIENSEVLMRDIQVFLKKEH